MRFKKTGKGSVLSGLKLTSEKFGKITLKTSSVNADGISVSKASGGYGSLQAQEVKENNCTLFKVSVRPKRKFLLEVSSRKPMLALLFNLGDEVHVLTNGNIDTLTAFQYEHGLFYMPSVKTKVGFQAKKNYGFVLIAFEAEYLLRYKVNHLLTEFFDKVSAGEPVQLVSPRNFSAEIAGVLQDIFPAKKFAPSMYREAKVLQLLHTEIEDLTSCMMLQDPIPIVHRISLQKLRSFLLRNLSKKVTLRELAAKFHLPASFIGKNFKALNGVSVQEFIKHERMRKAYVLVRSSSLSLTRIARLSGYRKTSNFSWDFKKHFGESPSEVRLPAR